MNHCDVCDRETTNRYCMTTSGETVQCGACVGVCEECGERIPQHGAAALCASCTAEADSCWLCAAVVREFVRQERGHCFEVPLCQTCRDKSIREARDEYEREIARGER